MPFDDAQNETTFRFDAFDLADRMLSEPASPPSRPQDFGPFRFLEDRPRGQGSLGDVWQAEDAGKGRRVAIKFLRTVRPELADNEVKAQARLEHRYIARLYGHGVLEDGTPWLEMEFVDGKPLGEYCKNCSIARRLAIFHAICEAVQYAHSEKVDHGDLKPANILVKENGEPKLVDFGLARRLHGLSGAADRAPVAGLTPAYAAPEQFRAESPGFRSDIYSLGIILYEVLSGTLPFDPATHTLTEMAVLKSARQSPAPPSAAANRAGLARELSRSQCRDLDALCLKAMESDVLQRYQSVESLLQDLDRYLRNEPLMARMPFPRGYRAARFLRRNRVWVSAASLMFVLIAGLVTFFTLRLAKERDRALAEAERTRRIQQFMLDLFGEEDQTAAPSKDLTVLAVADHWAAGLAILKSDPETETELYETLGRVYEQLHQMPKAEKILQAGVEKARTLGPGNPLAVDALVQLGLLRGDQAQYPEAERLMREAVDLARRMHLPADNPRFTNAQLSLGRVLVQAGDYEKGLSILQPIVNRTPKGEEETVNLVESLNAVGLADQYLGRYDRAEAANRRALDLDRKLHGDSHPRVATDLANIATTEMTLGHYPQAEDLYRQAAAIMEQRYGPTNVVALQIRSFIAVAEMRAGNHVEAQKLLQDLVPIEEKAYGTSVHPTVAFAHQTLGNLAEKRHNLAEAESEYRRALEINQKLYGADQYLTAVSASSLAGAVLQEGRYAEAEAIARPAVKALTARPMPGNMSVGIAQHNLGESILKQKRYQEAVGPLAAAYDYLKNLPSVPKDRLERVRADLLEAYDALKRPDLAAAVQSGQTGVTGR